MSECIDRYGRLVWSLARRYTDERTSAEDAVQDIFIDLWSSAPRYDPERASEETFIAMIARRRLIDRFRKHRREPATDDIETARGVAAPDGASMELRQDAARAAEVLQSLRPEQQDTLRLSIYQGYSHQEISDRLGMPLGTVKTHIRRGLAAIRDRMGQAGPASRQVTPS